MFGVAPLDCDEFKWLRNQFGRLRLITSRYQSDETDEKSSLAHPTCCLGSCLGLATLARIDLLATAPWLFAYLLLSYLSQPFWQVGVGKR